VNDPFLKRSVLLVAVALCAWAPDALAYAGPGSGLSALGALLAVLGAIALAVVGLVWYPFRRLIRFLRRKPKAGDEPD
jgi:hypothetical protein